MSDDFWKSFANSDLDEDPVVWFNRSRAILRDLSNRIKSRATNEGMIKLAKFIESLLLLNPKDLTMKAANIGKLRLSLRDYGIRSAKSKISTGTEQSSAVEVTPSSTSAGPEAKIIKPTVSAVEDLRDFQELMNKAIYDCTYDNIHELKVIAKVSDELNQNSEPTEKYLLSAILSSVKKLESVISNCKIKLKIEDSVLTCVAIIHEYINNAEMNNATSEISRKRLSYIENDYKVAFKRIKSLNDPSKGFQDSNNDGGVAYLIKS